MLLRHLGAALLVDDGRLFLDFLSWRAEYYTHRNIGPERLANALTAVASALTGDFARARRFVEEGRQHVAWLDRSGDNGVPVPAEARFSPADHLPVRPLAGARPALVAAAAGGHSGAFGGPLDVSRAPIRPMAPSGQEQPVRDQPGREQPGRVFADLLFVAATACHAPFALISVAQGDGRWSTLSHGVERRDLLADDRLFGVVAAAPGPVEFTDVSRYPEINSGPIARGPLGVRFVYGVPLRSRQNTLLGVLCVLDKRSRDLSNRERQALTAISRQIVGQLVMWRRAGTASSAGQAAVSESASEDRIGRHDRLGVAARSASERPRLHVHRDGGEELLRSHEVAVLFDVTDRTVINWAAANKLPSIRTAGGHLRFRGDDVLALLAGRPVRSAV